MTSLPTAHPVLLETTHTYLVWVRADTPAAARHAAQKNPQEFLGDLDACDGAQVDASIDTAAVSEDTAAWLDLEPAAYDLLDDYFAAAADDDIDDSISAAGGDALEAAA